jgi:hypothetical protein
MQSVGGNVELTNEDAIRCQHFNFLDIIALVVGLPSVAHILLIKASKQQAANTYLLSLAPNLQNESLLVSEDVFQCEGRSFLSNNFLPQTTTGSSFQISFYFHYDWKTLSTSYSFK